VVGCAGRAHHKNVGCFRDRDRSVRQQAAQPLHVQLPREGIAGIVTFIAEFARSPQHVIWTSLMSSW
jgi:hypothetical protein